MNIWIVLIDSEFGTSHYAYNQYEDAFDSVKEYLAMYHEDGEYDGPDNIPADYSEYVNGDTVVISETIVQ